MKRIINALERRPDPEVVEGFGNSHRIYSPSCVVVPCFIKVRQFHRIGPRRGGTRVYRVFGFFASSEAYSQYISSGTR